MNCHVQPTPTKDVDCFYEISEVVFMLTTMLGTGTTKDEKSPLLAGIFHIKVTIKARPGAYFFKNDRTGAIVTIQDSESKEVCRHTFDEDVKKQKGKEPDL